MSRVKVNLEYLKSMPVIDLIELIEEVSKIGKKDRV